MNKTWISSLLAAAVAFACTPGEQASRPADSTARNLTLAPTESTAAMKDVPAPTPTEAAKRAPEKKVTPAPKPPAPLTAAAGTRVPLAAGDTISTRQAKAGDPFSATVSQDVKDASGRVVIPAGSTVEGTIVTSHPAPNPNSSGELTLAVKSVTVRGTSYAIEGTVESKDTVMKGRGVTGAD